MFFLGGNFVSSLIWTQSKKPKNLKNLKTFSKKPRFFPALDHDDDDNIMMMTVIMANIDKYLY